MDAARLLLERAVNEADASADGLPSVLNSSVAKCFANEAAVEVTGTAMQLMGGYGYSAAFPMERRVRDALGWRVAGGTWADGCRAAAWALSAGAGVGCAVAPAPTLIVQARWTCKRSTLRRRWWAAASTSGAAPVSEGVQRRRKSNKTAVAVSVAVLAVPPTLCWRCVSCLLRCASYVVLPPRAGRA